VNSFDPPEKVPIDQEFHPAEKSSRATSYFLLVRRTWICLCVFLLGWALYTFNAAGSAQPLAYRNERVLLLALLMLSLTFPSGFTGPFLTEGIAYVLSPLFSFSLDEPSSFSIFLMWLSFFICGYLQWFQLTPWIIKKVRERRAKGVGLR
jgi:hypothetical protein